MEDNVYMNFENNQGIPMNDVTLNELQRKIKEDIRESIENISKLHFPIGSTYITQDNTNPATILGFGTWERLKGKLCLGLDEDDEDLNAIGKTGGEKEHTLTVEELPQNIGKFKALNWSGDTPTGAFSLEGQGADRTCATGSDFGGATFSLSGGGQAHNNMQPYEVVGYMWIRRS